jgi:putative acetyltransferase
MTNSRYSLRPFLPSDTLPLRELFAQSIEELTQEDYDADQRAAWASAAEDALAFAKKLGGMLTLVVQVDDEYVGFGSLKDNKRLDMLYVHPHHVGEGIGTALADALERIAAARGATVIEVDASETAIIFFEGRGYVQTQRNAVPVDDVWLSNTTMKKQLRPEAGKSAS